MKTLAEIFKEEEMRLIKQNRAKQAEEDAAWNALSQEEKDAWAAKQDAKWAALEKQAAEYVDEIDEEEDEDD